MSNISAWSTSAAANNSASPDGWPEGMLPSGVNDSARENMAAVKRWYVDAEWRFFEYAFVRQTNNSFLVSVTATDVFTAGRRLRLIDGGVTIYGDVIASTMAAANTLVTVSSSVLSSSLSSGSVAIIDPAQTSLPFMNALTATASVTASDYIEIWQSGTGLRRRALQTNVVRGSALSLQTEVDISTGAASYTLASSIPSWCKRITVNINGMSTNGTSNIILQIGDSGGPENSGYVTVIARISGGSASEAPTTGFPLAAGVLAASLFSGMATIAVQDSANNEWCFMSSIARPSVPDLLCAAGTKPLSATLDRVILTTVNGIDLFDAGAASVILEG